MSKKLIYLFSFVLVLAASPLLAIQPPTLGNTIVFASNCDGSYDIWRINADGSNPMNLTNTPQINEDYPLVSPDRSMIAYITTDARPDDYHLWVMDTDGSNPRQIVGSIPVQEEYSWSPDSRWIAYAEYIPWQNYLHRVNVHTLEDITLITKNCFAPMFSPDCNQIVFSYSNGGWFKLGAISSNGSNERVIAPDAHSTFGLWLSSSRILYTRSPVGQAASLCTLSPDGAGRDCFFNNGLIHGRMACSLSPDGSRIAASIWDHTLGEPKYTGRIVLLDPDGENSNWIQDPSCSNLFAYSNVWWSRYVWSPDSSQIVYQSDCSGTWDLTLADRDGANRRLLYDSGGNDVHSCWWTNISAPPGKAQQPYPAEGQTDVPRDVVLSWTPGLGAMTHDVYFGTSSPPAFIGNQAEASYDPGPLELVTTYYWQIDAVEADGTIHKGDVWSFTTRAQILAFPGAEGYGAASVGGRGGQVIKVTNLNDSGPGSLREAIETSGPRIVVFEVSGNIMLRDRLRIRNPYITIAGQTAPGDGITLRGHALYIYASDVIVRYIRCRFGDVSGEEKDAVSIASGSNIIFDHVTASWSVDETFSCQSSSVDSLTVQWCMITESMRYSIHEKGAHGYGGIIGSIRQSFHHNLYAHHSSRSPKVTGRRHCEVDFRNNVIYNWGYNSCYDGTSSYLNWANNYYKAGPGTESGVRDRIFQLSDEDIPPGSNNSPEDSQNYETSLYAEGNYVDGYPAVTADNWSGGIDFYNGATEAKNRVHTPFDFPAITEQTAEGAYPLVVAGAGASLVRDSIDERIVNEVLTGTVTYGNDGIIDSQDDVGGWPELVSTTPPTDTDQDGMPDDWELALGLDPNEPSDANGDLNGDGYTNIEEYINWIPTRHKETPPPLGFETGDFSGFNWTFSGDANWTISSEEKNSGNYGAQAGSISDDEYTTLEITLDCVSGDISFYCKVSSESNFDYLKFYIDGVEKNKWSGEHEWEQVSFPVEAGTRTFTWTYSKDDSSSRGSDTAWLDDIVFPIP